MATGHLETCLQDMSSTALSQLLPLFEGLTEPEKATILADFHTAVDKAFLETCLFLGMVPRTPCNRCHTQSSDQTAPN